MATAGHVASMCQKTMKGRRHDDPQEEPIVIDETLSWSIIVYALLDLFMWAAVICVLICVACVFIRGTLFCCADWLDDLIERWRR